MRHRRLPWITGTALLALLAAPFSGLAQKTQRHAAVASSWTRARANCARMATLTIPNTQITSSELILASDDLPEYCLVVGVVSPAVGFEVRLPTRWNQKLYFAGNGAFAGSIPDIDFETSFGLKRGYATAATNTGHQGDPLDASWALDNRPAEIDYGYRSVHVTTLVAKILIDSYYGQKPQFSYFDGCSKGGEQGLREAEQYPADFNGIAAGSPALDFTGLLIAANWNFQALHATANSSDIPVEKVPVIEAAVLANCDAVDGLVDGLIDDPRRCSFDPDILRCLGGDAPDCLTGRQVRALKKIYAGPTNSSGIQLFPGLPVGGETLEWNGWLINGPDGPSLTFLLQEPFFRYLAFRVDDPNFDWSTFDFNNDPRRLQFMAGILNATDTDLAAFHGAGGKLLMYHGWSDPIIAATRTIDYYRDVRRKLGPRKTAQSVRLFMAPGMAHCGAGSGPYAFDYFSALEDWVERGIAPESMVAEHSGFDEGIARTRPLCAYPNVARYTGSGSIYEAANFHCAQPADNADNAERDDH